MPAKVGKRRASPEIQEAEPSQESVVAAFGGLNVAGSRQDSGASSSSKKSSKISSRSASSGKFFCLFHSSHSVFDMYNIFSFGSSS